MIKSWLLIWFNDGIYTQIDKDELLKINNEIYGPLIEEHSKATNEEKDKRAAELVIANRGRATINVKNSHVTIFVSKYCHISPLITFVMSQKVELLWHSPL